jgi:predicted AlkP superfamily phosphohydrolase/phosphomutase
MNMSHKVFVIGLDGATFDLVRPWAEAGYLPNLSEFLRDGTSAPLRSTIPPVSPVAWSTFMTGKKPGKHGVFDFLIRDFDSYGMQVTTRPQQPTLWKLLSDAGRSVCVINVPQTFPPEKVSGIMVTGLGTPAGRIFTHPESLSSDLKAKGFRFVTQYSVNRDGADAFIQGVHDVADNVTDTAINLMRQIDWDFGMVVLRLTDEIPHYFWHYMDPQHPRHPEGAGRYHDAILDCYRKADTLIGRLVYALDDPDANVIILSDHGFGPLHKDVYLNEWLRLHGYLRLRPSKDVPSVRGWIRKLGLTQSQLGKKLGRLGMDSLRAFFRDRFKKLATILPKDEHIHVNDLVDWDRTQAYSVGYIGQIFLNLRGRDPNGVVSPGEEYKRVRAAIMKDLLDWRVGDEPVVDHVYCKEEIYQGPYLKLAPDLLVVMRGLTYITRQGREFPSGNEILVPPPTGETGGHRMNGVLLAKGQSIARHEEIQEVNIADITPTILHLLGCEIPSDMDGAVISDMFSDSFKNEHVVEYTEADMNISKMGKMSERDEEDVLNRLRDLGYIN